MHRADFVQCELNLRPSVQPSADTKKWVASKSRGSLRHPIQRGRDESWKRKRNKRKIRADFRLFLVALAEKVSKARSQMLERIIEKCYFYLYWLESSLKRILETKDLVEWTQFQQCDTCPKLCSQNIKIMELLVNAWNGILSWAAKLTVTNAPCQSTTASNMTVKSRQISFSV